MTIRFRRRMSGAAGAPSSLGSGQPAWNSVDQILYFGDGDDGGGNATSIKAIAGSGAVVTLSGAQTISGAKTFSSAAALAAASTVVAPATGDNSTAIVSSAWVRSQNYLTANQSITLSGDATGSGTTAIAVTFANSGVSAGTHTKVTVDAKGRVTVGASLAAGDIPTLTASKISDFDTQVRTSRLDQMAAPTASVALGGQRITGLADPSAATDAVTKQYADALASGTDYKESVRVATTAAITLSGTQTIDGVAVVAGNRVLVKDQASAPTNGIYVVAAGAWARSADADASAEVTTGLETFVEEGTANGGKVFKLTTPGPITLGTTGLSFSVFGGGVTYGAGNGLTLTGSTFSVVPVNTGRITVGGSGVDLATTGVGASTYKSVTVDVYGRVTAGTNPTTLAGYGITDAQGLDAELTAIAGLTSAADRLPYFTGSGTASLATFTAFGRSLVDDADASAGRTTLGLGTIATQNANAVALTGGTISSAVVIDDGTF